MTDTRVVYDLPSQVDHSVAAQRYFALALSTVSDLRIAGEPWTTRRLDSVEAKLGRVYRLALLRQRSRLPFLRTRRDAAVNGRYVASFAAGDVRFAIDARDQPDIFDEDELAWSDVYFKANWWPTREYDPKVTPLINGNGFLDRQRVAQLRELRECEKDIDIAFVTNVWGGREHVVRLYEQLARVPGANVLHAVFPWGFDDAETDAFKRRLAAAGVTSSDAPVGLGDLTETMARARIVFFRAGKHLCIPWRMLDVLAMGAAIVMDAPPFPQWYAPLERGRHYADCGLDRPADTSPAPDDQYERIVPAVSGLLADNDRLHALRSESAAYFDRYAAPEPLGRHILDTLRHAGATSSDRG